MSGEFDGFSSFLQWETMGDQSAHVQLTGENQAGDLFLKREIGGIAAEEVFFVDADGGEVRGEEA